MSYNFIKKNNRINKLFTARSPVVGHMNCTLGGLATIRAFNAEENFKKEFDKHQDIFTSASLNLQISMTAFGFFMDVLSALLTGLVVIRLLIFEQSRY